MSRRGATHPGVEGQHLRVIGIHHGRVWLENDNFPGRFQRRPAHGHQQVHHLQIHTGDGYQPSGFPECLPVSPAHGGRSGRLRIAIGLANLPVRLHRTQPQLTIDLKEYRLPRITHVLTPPSTNIKCAYVPLSCGSPAPLLPAPLLYIVEILKDCIVLLYRDGLASLH